MTAESAKKLMDPRGEYCLHEGRFALRMRQELQEQGRMPFELPSGAVDSCTNLAQFRLRLPRAARPAEVLGEPPPGLAVDAKENRGMLYFPEADEPLVWAGRTSRGPGEYLIWPHWRREAFLTMMQDAAMVAEHAHGRLGGELLWLEEPWTEQRRRVLTDWPNLLGVELYEMITQGQDPRPREAVETRQ